MVHSTAFCFELWVTGGLKHVRLKPLQRASELAAEKGTSFSTILPHPRPQGLAAVDNIQMELSEVQPAIGQVREQSVACGLVLPGALMKSEDRFTPRFIDA